ncbi:hypothetical protein DENIS_0352 [Desulfonema ishimotonii]|uniref:Calcineurin-like phosphoesterase domain-containing protein n=1 Tax=Desulfonema ishimotonii TaxID=45657 RepID=A0A401FR27_9BACT|nr:metallophosphoesterase [Desulfonema ishimotonii]GBC59413.1 hypothetical protein DENIS_0352 [Desulfonema ishimotonii]
MGPGAERRITRRALLKYGLRLSALGVCGMGFEARNNLRIERVRLPFPNLPPAFRGFRIVQISDLHASFWVTQDYLAEVVRQINRLPSDLVVITGDFLTGAVNRFWKRWLPFSPKDYTAVLAGVLSHLEPGDKIAVLGNHDQGNGGNNEQCLVDELERIGIRVLRNESLTLRRGDHRICLAGTDDFWFSYDLSKTLRGVPEGRFKILLSHNPDASGDITPEMRVDLTLCGHTHGGQVVVPFLTRFILPINSSLKYMAGLVREPYGYTYVNRGIGTLVFPFRISAPPEITHFTLI